MSSEPTKLERFLLKPRDCRTATYLRNSNSILDFLEKNYDDLQDRHNDNLQTLKDKLEHYILKLAYNKAAMDFHFCSIDQELSRKQDNIIKKIKLQKSKIKSEIPFSIKFFIKFCENKGISKDMIYEKFPIIFPLFLNIYTYYYYYVIKKTEDKDIFLQLFIEELKKVLFWIKHTYSDSKIEKVYYGKTAELFSIFQAYCNPIELRINLNILEYIE